MNCRDRRPEVRQEPDLLPARKILAVVTVTLVVAAVLVAAASALVGRSERRLRPSGRFPEEHIVLPPRVRALDGSIYAFGGRGAAQNAQKRAYLARYHWVDRERRVVDIPVEEAFQLLAEDGAYRRR